MKELLLVLVLALMVNFTANANYSGRGECRATSRVAAVCQFCNSIYSRSIYCSMRMVGQTASGAQAYNIVSGTVYPGQCLSGYVNARNPYMDPLLFANAQVDCRFVGGF